uniref:Uncharacterized protein n=1 Tax=Anguilla anguilla TaxID=7936 RepID=A0A0E9UIC0_ANGAN
MQSSFLTFNQVLYQVTEGTNNSHSHFVLGIGHFVLGFT